MLQFAPRICWPLDTGAKLRNFHLARVLSTSAQVALLAFAEDEQPHPELEDIYERVISVQRDKAYSVGRMVRGAVGSTPLPLLNYTTEEMKRALAGLLAEDDFDIIQIESIHLMNYLPVIRAARQRTLVICDWHNIESDLMQQYSEREGNLARKTYARKTARLMKKSEERALGEFDAHMAVSENDADRLRKVNSRARVFVIENGVDAASYSGEPAANRNRIVFVGSMDYHANVDGAIAFARTAWPLVHKRMPELVFTIVGRDPAPEVRELSSIPGVEVTGSVADVRPYYREASAAVVPLNVGGGSRLKILEAMAAGVPVVSTSRGAEGLHVSDGENILLTESIAQLPDRIVSVSDDQALRQRLIAGGRALVKERYDWTSLGAQLLSTYQDLLAGP